ncbi:MAG: asparagine--tRNA ligase, partial [Clostridia bacterium]|nr:asparagine--tRNA ligase [Clostridia bacterium]
MDKRIYVKELYQNAGKYADKTIIVAGWTRTLRDSKSFGFIELNDGSYFKNVQVVFEREKIDNYDEIAKQNVGTAFIVKGVLVLTPEAKQPFEIKADCIMIEGASTPDY